MNTTAWHAACKELDIQANELGIMVVDHGSRREASNLALLQVVELFKRSTDYPLVEPAHMELAEPSIESAFTTLVSAGAKMVVVHPYFLLPGRHWAQDIPELAAAAAKKHPHVRYLVTAPLGIHPLMSKIMDERISHCMQHVTGAAAACDVCETVGKCQESGSFAQNGSNDAGE